MIFYIICHDNTISLAFKKLKTAIPVVFSTCTATITHTFYPIDPLLPYDTKFQDKKMRRNFLSVFNHQLFGSDFCKHYISQSHFYFIRIFSIDKLHFVFYLSFILLYSLLFNTFLYAGLIILSVFISSSILWALQPDILAVANIGVYNSKGKSSIL